ncbi:DUF3107 domain-containing protein [Acaricomes phytoseiuli]|uniref:DUF3107 domain-containing protein n=1 Tax=Acaricomes phytoseiuli TaxID=291968 RepID=UPI000376684B|nr:DUF3107 domain-containing protein [Acaricomes phytoseiuli]MCW1249030.1 DUF3107 domain-containing protein [Acaricomes phytoseiuli]
MEIKIGIQNIGREVVLESDQEPAEVEKLVADALSEGGQLKLADAKGRAVVVPVQAIGYVEIGAEEPRRVGFGTL